MTQHCKSHVMTLVETKQCLEEDMDNLKNVLTTINGHWVERKLCLYNI